jgi:hypothetical protein
MLQVLVDVVPPEGASSPVHSRNCPRLVPSSGRGLSDARRHCRSSHTPSHYLWIRYSRLPGVQLWTAVASSVEAMTQPWTGPNLEATVETRYVKLDDFNRLKLDHQALTSQVVVLTAVVGGITCAGTVDFDRLEECVTFALKQVRPSTRPVFLARASAVMEDLEKMQKALVIEKRKSHGFKTQCRGPALPAG